MVAALGWPSFIELSFQRHHLVPIASPPTDLVVLPGQLQCAQCWLARWIACDVAIPIAVILTLHSQAHPPPSMVNVRPAGCGLPRPRGLKSLAPISISIFTHKTKTHKTSTKHRFWFIAPKYKSALRGGRAKFGSCRSPHPALPTKLRTQT